MSAASYSYLRDPDMSAINDLKRRATEAELEVIVKPDGHVIVIGGLVNVHWWPNSKRRTAWVEGAPAGRPNTTAKQVISLAVKGTPA